MYVGSPDSVAPTVAVFVPQPLQVGRHINTPRGRDGKVTSILKDELVDHVVGPVGVCCEQLVGGLCVFGPLQCKVYAVEELCMVIDVAAHHAFKALVACRLHCAADVGHNLRHVARKVVGLGGVEIGGACKEYHNLFCPVYFNTLACGCDASRLVADAHGGSIGHAVGQCAAEGGSLGGVGGTQPLCID